MPTIPESTSRKSVTLPDSMWSAVDEYRFYNRIPTEAGALRQLIQKGLDLPLYLERQNATIEILARRLKHYPGPFDTARDPFTMTDLLACEVRKAMPSLNDGQAAQLAEEIFKKAQEEAGADADYTRALLNADWKRFVPRCHIATS